MFSSAALDQPGLSYAADAAMRDLLATLPQRDGRPYVQVTGNERTFSDGRPVDSFGRTPEEAAWIAGARAAHAGTVLQADESDWFGRGYLATVARLFEVSR